MANKSICFSIFVLREYFTGTNYPRELILLIMKLVIDTRNILEIKTCQVKILKELFGMMSDIISEYYIHINKAIFYMAEMTSDKNRLIKLCLTKFDLFYCEESILYLGINMKELNNQMVSIDNTVHSITLCIRNDTRHILRICSDSKEIKHILHKRSFGYESMPNVQFEHTFSMNYTKFDALCERLNKSSEFVTIDSNGIRSCDGDPTRQQSFELKSLLVLRPYRELCANINIWERNNFPLVIQIQIGTLGKLFYYISPLS